MNIKIARSRIVVGIAVLSLFVIAGCGGDDKASEQPSPGSHAADAAKTDHSGAEHPQAEHPQGEHPQAEHPSAGATIAGITFSPPGHWQDLGSSGMRQAQYRLDPVAGDPAPGEVNLFYFGPTSGGGVEANLKRWIGQIVLPDGGDPNTVAERSTFTADGMPGHIVTLNGTYKSGGGRPMGGETTMLEGYRLVGVVLEGPQGSLFFKLTGPLATAQAMEKDLMAMVKGAHK